MGELSAGEVEKLKGYETKNKKRHSPLERFQGSLAYSDGRVRRYESAHIGTRTIPQYEIPRRYGGPPELLSISLQAGDEKVLPVFSSEMLAWASSDAATSVRSIVSATLTAASWSRCYSGRTRT